MKFLMKNLRLKAAGTDNVLSASGMSLVRAAMLDARAYGISSAVSALLRDLRD